eukprot:jgi/Bigna1/79789/fgenesh1_pg.65_\
MAQQKIASQPNIVSQQKRTNPESHRWYYVDTNQQRMGPVSAEKLKEIWTTTPCLNKRCVVWNMDDNSFQTWTMIKNLPKTYFHIFSAEKYKDPSVIPTWHYVDAKEKRHGPVPLDELRDMFWENKMTRQDLVWDSTGKDNRWAKLETIAAFPSFAKPKPLPRVPMTSLIARGSSPTATGVDFNSAPDDPID